MISMVHAIFYKNNCEYRQKVHKQMRKPKIPFRSSSPNHSPPQFFCFPVQSRLLLRAKTCVSYIIQYFIFPISKGMRFRGSICLSTVRAKVKVKVLFLFNVDGCSGSFFWSIKDKSFFFVLMKEDYRPNNLQRQLEKNP